MAKEIPTRKAVRNTSRSCVTTKFRITSTSDVQRWIISPVWFLSCQLMGSRCTWENKASLRFLAKFSPARAVQTLVRNINIPDSTATATTARDSTKRCSLRYGYPPLPSTLSMLKRKICGVTALRAVVRKEAATAHRKYRLEP